MKLYRNRYFSTLSEWLAVVGNTLPTEWLSITIRGAVNFANLFQDRYGDRYIAIATDTAAPPVTFGTRLAIENARIYSHFAPLIAGAKKMIDDLVADEDTETNEIKRSTNGQVDFTSTFSDGGTVRHRSGASSGNVDRIVRLENELSDMIEKFLDAFAPLFVPVLSEWGCEV